MNNVRREKLRDLLEQLSALRDRLDELTIEEMDYAESMPENLHGSERHEKSEAAAAALDDALSSLDEATDHIETAIE